MGSNNVQTCCKCLQVLKEGTAYELEGRRWHVECFTCSECGASLDCDDNLLVLGDGRQLICGNCSFHCHICQKKIQQTAIVTGDQAYCRECFRCRNCNKNIESLRHARTSQGVFCVPCYDLVLAKRAAKKKDKKKQHHHKSSNNKSLPAKPDEGNSNDSNTTVTANHSNTPSRSDTPEVLESDCIPILIESPVQRQLRDEDAEKPTTSSPQRRHISPIRSAASITPANIPMMPPSRSTSRNKLILSPESEQPSKGHGAGLDVPLPIISKDTANVTSDIQALLQIPARSRQRSLSPSKDRQTITAAQDSKPASPTRPSRHPPQSSGSDSLNSSSTKDDSVMTTATSHDFGVNGAGDNDDNIENDKISTLGIGRAGFPAPPPPPSERQLSPPPPPRSPARHKPGSGSRSRSTSVGIESIPVGETPIKQKLFSSSLADGGLAITLDHDRLQGESNHFENRKYFVHEPVAPVAAGATNDITSKLNDDNQDQDQNQAGKSSPEPEPSRNRSRTNTANSLTSPRTPSKMNSNSVSASTKSSFLDKLHAVSPRAASTTTTTVPQPGSVGGNSLVTPPHISQPVFQSSSASVFRSPRNLQENTSLKRRNSRASHHERSISDHTLEKLAAFGSQVTRRSTHKSNRSGSNIPDHESPLLGGLGSGGHHRKKSSSNFSPFLGGSNNGSNIDEDTIANLKESLAAANRKIMLLEAKLMQHEDPQEHKTKRYIADLEAKENILQRALKVMDDEVTSKTENALNSRGEEVIAALNEELNDMKRSMHEEITSLTLERDELIEANRQLENLRDRQSAEESVLSAKNAQLTELNAELTKQIQDLMKENKSPNTGLLSPQPQPRGINNHEQFSDSDINLQHHHNRSNSSNNNIFGAGPEFVSAAAPAVSPEKQFRTGITTDMISSPIPIADLSKNGNGNGGYEGPAVTILDGPDSSRFVGGAKAPMPGVASNNRRGFWRMVPGVRNLNRFLGSEQQQQDQLLGMSYSNGGLSGSMSHEDLSLESVNEASHDEGNHGGGLGRASSVRTRMNRSRNNLMRRGGSNGVNDNTERPPLFGGELSIRAAHEGYQIPFIVTRCIEEVEKRGVKFEGIYRKSGAKSQIQALQEAFEVSNYSHINKLMEGDINAITSVCKQYLRHLTVPLIVFELYDEFINASIAISESSHETAIELHRQLIYRLPDSHRLCLEAIIKHLAKVSTFSAVNLMPSKNLAVVFAPTLARDPVGERELQDMRLRNDGIEFMITNVDAVF